MNRILGTTAKVLYRVFAVIKVPRYVMIGTLNSASCQDAFFNIQAGALFRYPVFGDGVKSICKAQGL